MKITVDAGLKLTMCADCRLTMPGRPDRLADCSFSRQGVSHSISGTSGNGVRNQTVPDPRQ